MTYFTHIVNPKKLNIMSDEQRKTIERRRVTKALGLNDYETLSDEQKVMVDKEVELTYGSSQDLYYAKLEQLKGIGNET